MLAGSAAAALQLPDPESLAREVGLGQRDGWGGGQRPCALRTWHWEHGGAWLLCLALTRLRGSVAVWSPGGLPSRGHCVLGCRLSRESGAQRSSRAHSVGEIWGRRRCISLGTKLHRYIIDIFFGVHPSLDAGGLQPNGAGPRSWPLSARWSWHDHSGGARCGHPEHRILGLPGFFDLAKLPGNLYPLVWAWVVLQSSMSYVFAVAGKEIHSCFPSRASGDLSHLVSPHPQSLLQLVAASPFPPESWACMGLWPSGA